MARSDENSLVQAAAVLDAVIATLKGEQVSDFFESFYPVRTIRDLMVRAEKAVGYREGHPLMCCGKCHDTLAASEERARRAEQAAEPLIFALRQIEIRAAAGAPAVEAPATLSWIARAANVALRVAPPPAATETRDE